MNENLFVKRDQPSTDAIRAEPITVFTTKGWLAHHPDGTKEIFTIEGFTSLYRPLTIREVISYYSFTGAEPDFLVMAGDRVKVNWRALQFIAEKRCSNGSGFSQILETCWRELADNATQSLIVSPHYPQ